MDRNFIIRFLKGSALTSLGTAASIICHFLSIIIITRTMTAAEYGIFIILLAMVHLLSILSNFGLNLTLVKFTASENGTDPRAVLRLVLLLRFISLSFISILFYPVRMVVLSFFSADAAAYVPFILILLYLNSFKELFYNYLQGLNLFRKYTIVQVVSAIIRVLAILLFALLQKLSLPNLITIEVITQGASLGLLVMLIPSGHLGRLRFHRQIFRSLIQFSGPLYLNNLLAFIMERVNVLIIGAYMNPVSIAYYDIAHKIPDALRRLFSALIIVYFPHSAKLFSEKSKYHGQRFMNTTLEWCAIAISILTLVSFLFRHEIIALLFSGKYAPAAMAFAILMLAFYFRAISSIMGYSLVSAGYPGISVKANAISGLLNFLGCLWLIPKYGFMGAVYSILLANILSQFIHYFYLIKCEIIADMKQYLTPLLWAVLPLCVYFLINLDGILVKIAIIGMSLWLGRRFLRDLAHALFHMYSHL